SVRPRAGAPAREGGRRHHRLRRRDHPAGRRPAAQGPGGARDLHARGLDPRHRDLRAGAHPARPHLSPPTVRSPRMITRLSTGVVLLLLAVEELVRAGPAAAAVVRPGELWDAVLSGDGSAGPWLLLAYGLLMVVRAVADREG